MAVLSVVSDDAPLGQFVADIVIGLADEGVPVSAIARAVKHPSAAVRRVIHDACGTGAITHVPRDDWPPGTRREERLPDVVASTPDDEAMIMACVRTFRVTRLQARLLSVLIRRPEATKGMLHQVVEQERDPTKDVTDLKIVDVVICHLRKRLRPMQLEIKTIWSCGYFMEAEQRARANAMLNDHQLVENMREPILKAV